MKNPIFITLLLHVIVFSAFAQSSPSFFSLEFLEINAQAQSKALGDAGVVSPYFNSHSANQQNPALLIRDFRQIDINLKYMPWVQVGGAGQFFLELGGMCNFSKRHAFGLNMKYLSDGLLNIPASGARSDYVVAMSYAYKFARRWSAGTTYKLIRNDVLSSDGTIGVSTSAVDLGVHYQNVKTLLDDRHLHFNFGLALTNLGPKVDFETLYSNMNLHNYLPTTLKAGVLFGIENKKNEQYTFAWNVVYQLDKRLDPIPTPADTDYDGQYDYLTWTLGQAMWRSLSDSPSGFRGELGELIHKAGLEFRVDDHQYNLSLAFRAGYSLATDERFKRRNVSAGIAVSLHKFYIDVSYVSSLNRQQKIYENTVLFSIGSRRTLADRLDDGEKNTLSLL